MEEGDTINLQELENLPYPALINILTNLDSKSLIKICKTSPYIRRNYCERVWKERGGFWKTLFERDVTRRKVCKGYDNIDYEKLYELAVTKKFTVYEIRIVEKRRVAGRKVNYDNSYIAFGRLNLKKILFEKLENMDFDYDSIDRFFENYKLQHGVWIDLSTIEEERTHKEYIGIKSLGNLRAKDILAAGGSDDLFTITSIGKNKKSIAIKKPVLKRKFNVDKTVGFLLKKRGFSRDGILNFLRTNDAKLEKITYGKTYIVILKGNIDGKFIKLEIRNRAISPKNLSELKNKICGYLEK